MDPQIPAETENKNTIARDALGKNEDTVIKNETVEAPKEKKSINWAAVIPTIGTVLTAILFLSKDYFSTNQLKNDLVKEKNDLVKLKNELRRDELKKLITQFINVNENFARNLFASMPKEVQEKSSPLLESYKTEVKNLKSQIEDIKFVSNRNDSINNSTINALVKINDSKNDVIATLSKKNDSFEKNIEKYFVHLGGYYTQPDLIYNEPIFLYKNPISGFKTINIFCRNIGSENASIGFSFFARFGQKKTFDATNWQKENVIGGYNVIFIPPENKSSKYYMSLSTQWGLPFNSDK